MLELSILVIAGFLTGTQGVATVGQTITNESVIIGNDASFFCEVIGTQDPITEVLAFNKDGSSISQNENSVNGTKYLITGKYNLTVTETEWSDEGEYGCLFGAVPYTAYLVLSDPPTTASIYWGTAKQSWSAEDVANNLTCESAISRPPATFRWYRGSSLVSGSYYQASTNATGYGKAYSFLTVTPTSSDEGVVYTCEVDIPGAEPYFTKTLSVAFSGAGTVASSLCMMLMAYLLSTHL